MDNLKKKKKLVVFGRADHYGWVSPQRAMSKQAGRVHSVGPTRPMPWAVPRAFDWWAGLTQLTSLNPYWQRGASILWV